MVKFYKLTLIRRRMEKEIYYLPAEKIIEFNVLALKLIQVKKADATKVLSHSKGG